MIEFLGITFFSLIVVFFIIIGYPLLGAFSGWIVSFLFDSPFLLLNHITNLEFTAWQWGASLGFIGAFFKTTNFKGNK